MFNFKKIGLALSLLLCLVIIYGCSSPFKLSDTLNKNVFQATSGEVSKESSSKGSKDAANKLSVLTVKVLDIGQGDAILVRAAGQTVLIDSGDIPERERLMAYLAKENITVLDKVIITHPHADHLGGMPRVFEKIRVKEIYDSGQTHNSSLYKQYLTGVKNHKIPFKIAAAGETINLGNDISLKILSPEKPYITGSKSDLNNNSIVVKLVFKNFSMLFTGDIEAEAESRLVKKYGAELKSSILKSPHHGSRTSSTTNFLKAVNPKAVIISVGTNNSYNHPNEVTLKRYDSHKIEIYRTDTDKTITVSSDGNSYTISKGRYL